MTDWLNTVKNLLSYYLGTQNNKYLITESGLRLWIVDLEYRGAAKIPSVFNGINKALSSWTGEPKS